MTPDQRRTTARVLGYICVVVGLLNLSIIGVHALQGQTNGGLSLLVTGIAALGMGAFILALGKGKSTP